MLPKLGLQEYGEPRREQSIRISHLIDRHIVFFQLSHLLHLRRSTPRPVHYIVDKRSGKNLHIMLHKSPGHQLLMQPDLLLAKRLFPPSVTCSTYLISRTSKLRLVKCNPLHYKHCSILPLFCTLQRDTVSSDSCISASCLTNMPYHRSKLQSTTE